jgi:hypothetical protein
MYPLSRWLLFAAVAVNDFRSVHRLLTTGFDINSRVTLADEIHMARLWRTRCVTPKQRAPFFMCSAVEEEHRPNALHFAVYFNARECVELLLDAGADETLPVWFGDVKEAEGKFVENVSLSTKQPRKVMSSAQLVETVFQRNVHRITADPSAKNGGGWPAGTTRGYPRWLSGVHAPRGAQRLTAEELDRKMAGMWVATGAGGDADEAAVLAAIAEGPESSKEPQRFSKPGTPAVTSAPAPGMGGLDSARSGTPMTRHRAGNDSPAARPGTTGSVQEVPDESKEDGQADDEDDEDGADAADAGASAKEPGFKRDKVIPRMRRLFTWRDHGLVEKIVGKPIVLEVKVPVTEAPPAASDAVGKAGMSGMTSRSRLSMRVGAKDAANKPGVTVKAGPPPARESVRFGTSTAKASSASTAFSSSMMTGKTASSDGRWVDEAAAQKFETVELPMLGKKSFWLESRALVVGEREAAYERTLLPQVGTHRLDRVERILLNAGKFKPGAPAPTAGAAAISAVASVSTDAEEESESLEASGDNTPGFITGSTTPFMMSPPGTLD